MQTREYAGRADLLAMQRLVGDVAWADTHSPGRQDEFRRVLFEEDGRVVAWAWLFRPSTRSERQLREAAVKVCSHWPDFRFTGPGKWNRVH